MRFGFFKQKKASENYTVSMMPTTRKQVFWDIWHLQGVRVFYVGLILLVFSLPLHALDLFEDAYVTGLASQVTQNTPQEDINVISYSVIAIKNIVGLVKIPLLVLLSIGIAGASRIVRQYCWIENVSIKHDFIMGVKQNAKHYGLLSLIFGVINYACTYFLNTSYIIGEQNYSFLLFLPIVLEVLIIMPITLIVCVCIPVYSNTFVQNLKVALTIVLKKYLVILLSSAILVLPFVIISELGFYPNLFIRLLYSLCGGFIMIAFNLFIYNVLDKHINSKFFPELVGKGTIWNEEI